MKYVALLSGGKDSCYNLLHCHKNGHELIAAASLSPGTGKEEIDSYMYQTVGQDAIEFVARALEVPLFRKVITGSAVEQGSEYGGRNAANRGGIEGDETEDLYTLLHTVKTHHPDVEGVSVGAILSNYQRVRVEHVCRRLALTPLCYLWQRNQGELLSEMIEAGLEAILIKVAGIGLTEKHLGKTLSQMQPTLIKLNNLYGSHICGEGGEYETFTLDCPLFKSRIILNETEVVVHSDNEFAPVAFFRMKDVSLERKSDIDPLIVQTPLLLESEATQVYDAISVAQSRTSFEATRFNASDISSTIPHNGMSSKAIGPWIAVANVHRDLSDDIAELTIEEEVRQCFSKLQGRLKGYSLSLSHCANINVFLASMDHFPKVNAVYTTFFGSSPPARACVAIDLPSPIRIKLDCIACAEASPNDRQALHVQGLSYWAPANIGPYSQAIMIDERIFISGQIGLIPSSLALPSPPSLAEETALCFQHVERVKAAFKANTGDWEGHTQASIYWIVDPRDVRHVRMACDVFGLNQVRRIAISSSLAQPLQEFNNPTLIVAVKSLPRDARIEKQVLIHSGRCMVADEDGELTTQSKTPSYAEDDLVTDSGKIHWEASHFDEINASCAIIFVRGKILNQFQLLPLSSFWSRTLSIRLFHRLSQEDIWSSPIGAVFSSGNVPPITTIPCRFIASQDEDNWDYAIYLMAP
ncbi:hypothetical protein BJ138DRAFT_1169482 [Hygrophoropsis aurantiaca]|uniref:Uncharacterized protein n=1 Tax=Hygrophoropsis aurantiaca TaxID=72124 RepID=A0ACB8ARM0_9AGAM|nr:hypothetical protein BJ138DRAFT_1169482 [Hygrophoropsis aurantiaca]